LGGFITRFELGGLSPAANWGVLHRRELGGFYIRRELGGFAPAANLGLSPDTNLNLGLTPASNLVL
jgi:hypothetical protein